MSVQLTCDQRVYRFETDSISIGRHPQNQLALNDDRVSEWHALLHVVQDRWIVEAKESAGIQVGNGRSVQFAWVNSGDTIRLSDTGPAIQFEIVRANAQDQQSRAVPAQQSAPEAASPIRSDRRGSPQSALKSPKPITAGIDDLVAAGVDARSLQTSAPRKTFHHWIHGLPVSAKAGIACTALLFVLFWSRRGEWKDPPGQALPAAMTPQSDDANPRNVTKDSEPETAFDPADLMVLVGIGDLSSDNRPHILAVGWLWNDRTVVVSRVIGAALEGVITELRNQGLHRQACVMQGVVLEVSQIVAPSGCPAISVLKLKEPAEFPAVTPKAWQRVNGRDVDRLRGRGKSFRYLSFAHLPKSSGIQGGQGLSLHAYDPGNPAFTRREAQDASFELIERKHYLKPTGSGHLLELGGLILNDQQRLVGMALIDTSILWSDDLQPALENY